MPMSDPSRINAAWNGREAQDYERSRLVVPLEDALAVERELAAAQSTIAEQAKEIERLREALRGIEKALRTDSRDKSIIGDEVEYHLDGQTMYLAINAARRALGEEG